MALEAAALLVGLGLLALALCVKPVEAGLRSLSERARRDRRRRRKREETARAEGARRARQSRGLS